MKIRYALAVMNRLGDYVLAGRNFYDTRAEADAHLEATLTNNSPQIVLDAFGGVPHVDAFLCYDNGDAAAMRPLTDAEGSRAQPYLDSIAKRATTPLTDEVCPHLPQYDWCSCPILGDKRNDDPVIADRLVETPDTQKRVRIERPGDQCARCTHTRAVHGKRFAGFADPGAGCVYCGATYCPAFQPFGER
jgi:hypothetical protein